MAKPKPAPKPKRPVDVDVEYFFCQNVSCNYHASFIVGRRPAEAKLTVGGICPQCGIGTIAVLELKQKEDVPLASGVVNAQALPAPPYGGLALQLGDSDAKQLFEGVQANDPAHVGARFVAELQRDLLRLAFYGPARGGELVGEFGTMVEGAVLDLKRHLVKFYGVKANPNFEQVQKDAEAADLVRTQQASDRAKEREARRPPGGNTAADDARERALEDAAERAFDDANKPKICFIDGGLVGPHQVYGLITPWGKALGDPALPGNQPTLPQAVEKWAARWERSKRLAFADTAATQKAVRDAVLQTTSARDQLKKDLVAANASQRSVANTIATLRVNRAKLSEAQISGLETAMDALIAQINAIGGGLPATLAQVKLLSASLPGTPNAPAEPASAPLTLSATAPADQTPPSRFDRVVLDDTTARQVLKDQGSLSTFIDRTVGVPKGESKKQPRSLSGRAGLAESEVLERDALGGVANDLAKEVNDQLIGATTAAQLLNAQNVKGTPNGAFQGFKARAVAQAAAWLRVAGPPPAGSNRPVTDGTVVALNARMAVIEASFNAGSIPLPPEWNSVKASVNQLLTTAKAFSDEIQKSDATTLMDAYVQMLRGFARVDGATARYIRRMVMDGRLGNQAVFRTPTGPELLPFSLAVDGAAALKAAIDEAAREAPSENPDVARLGLNTAPEPILRFIFTHESGALHSQQFVDSRNPSKSPGPQFVKLGVDWSGNPPGFLEQKADPTRMSTSRGWGFGQKTFFEIPVKLATTAGLDLKPPVPTEGPQQRVTFHSGIPYAEVGEPVPVPFVITSGRAAAKIGTKTLMGAFANTVKKRDCTLPPGQRFDCVNCLKNPAMKLGTRQRDAKDRVVRKGGMAFFNDAEGVFQRHLVEGKLKSHRFDSLETVKDLVARGVHQIVDDPPPAPTAVRPPLRRKQVDELGEGDTIEFPCSWLTAITLYAGAGEVAWYYALNGIFFLQNNDKLP